MQSLWSVKISKKAFKQIKLLPQEVKDFLYEFIEALKIYGPFPLYWDVIKLTEGEYRARLNYRYRVRYKVMKNFLLIEIFYLGHRKDAYKY